MFDIHHLENQVLEPSRRSLATPLGCLVQTYRPMVGWHSPGTSNSCTNILIDLPAVTFTKSHTAFCSSSDKTIKVWDIGARAAVSTIQDTGEVWSVSWRPKPPQHGSPGAFVSAGEDGVVRWWRGAGTG